MRTLSQKIREQVSREQELLAQKEEARVRTQMLTSLLDHPARGKSRLKASKGQLAARLFRARARARVAKTSRRVNRRRS